MTPITVLQLNNYIKQVFEAEAMLHSIDVVGEVQSLKVQSSVAYFSLMDSGAVIQCSCFIPQKLQGIKNGDRVVVRGSIGYWHKAGKIIFQVTKCEVAGLGALFLQFEQLKKKLMEEGLFDASAKKPLPQKVRRIGVVTSKTGAVIHDICTVVKRRNPTVSIVLFPVQVQGQSAPQQIVDGINFFSNYNVDAIIVARGGGSSEDLAPFNSEQVARSCFASKIPVVSAVGHETDFTLLDFVADLRAPTPTAAAELLVAEVLTQNELVLRMYKHLRYTTIQKCEYLQKHLVQLYNDLRQLIHFRIEGVENRLRGLSDVLEAKNPLAILKKGYAKVFLGQDVIMNRDDVKIGDNIRVKFYDFEIGAKVWELTKN